LQEEERRDDAQEAEQVRGPGDPARRETLLLMVPPLAKQESRSQCEECAADCDEGALTRNAQGNERNAHDEKWNSRPSFHIILPYFQARLTVGRYSGEPSRQSERPERMRGRRVP